MRHGSVSGTLPNHVRKLLQEQLANHPRSPKSAKVPSAALSECYPPVRHRHYGLANATWDLFPRSCWGFVLRYRVNHPQVIDEIVDGEAIIINLADGSYYSLDSVGSEVWTMVEQSRSVDQIVSVLSGRYDASEEIIRGAVEDLLARLAVEELVAPENGQPSPARACPPHLPTTERRPFQVPRFEKFTDMQDLILLDPVHEVGSRGWPHGTGRYEDN